MSGPTCTPCGGWPVVVIIYTAAGGWTAWCSPCWKEVWP